MASLLFKAIIVVGGLMAISSGGVGYFILGEKEKPVSVLLKENNKVLLQETDSAGWTANWSKFKKKYTKDNAPTDKWTISGTWATVFDANTVSEDFKKKCTTNSQIKVKNKKDILYKEVEEYCSKDA